MAPRGYIRAKKPLGRAALNQAVAVAEWQGPACIGRWPWRPHRALRVKALLRRRLVDMTSP